ncbi:hypothetical protein BKA65DRAFT_556301 [Rhexocercosporidium sp. MPI-PUGE-AT-0058]|nr:hypothetical protein BKA65DRAFT_556301 [Rhexocercosporidium sp. MPI-PUGE-AT-0058]
MADKPAGLHLPGDDGADNRDAVEAEQPGPEPQALQPNDGEDENEHGAEGRGPRVFSMLHILFLVTVVCLVSSYAAMVTRLYTDQYWGATSPNDSGSEKSIWERLRANSDSQNAPRYWNKIDSAPSALESLRYDSLRDRVLRYVTSTKGGRPSQPTVLTATYVRQHSEQKSSLPSSSIPKHFGDKVFGIPETKITAGTLSFREWLSSEVQLLKPDNTSPASRDKINPRRSSLVEDLIKYRAKVVEEIKVLEEKFSKAMSKSKAKSKTHVPFSVEDLNAYAEKVAEEIASLGDKLLKTQTASHKMNTKQSLISKADIDGYKIQLAKKMKNLGEILIESPQALQAQKESGSPGGEAIGTEGNTGFRGWISSRISFSKPDKTSSTLQSRLKVLESKALNENGNSDTKSKQTNEKVSGGHKVKTKTSESSDPRRDPDFPNTLDSIKSRSGEFSEGKTPVSGATPKGRTATRKGVYEKWWSTFRLQGPPTTASNKKDSPPPKLQTSSKSTKVPTSVMGKGSNTPGRKGSYELWWSEYRLQGPPTMASSSVPKEESSPLAPTTPKTPPAREGKNTADNGQILLSNQPCLPGADDSVTSAKKPKPSRMKIPTNQDAEVETRSTEASSKNTQKKLNAQVTQKATSPINELDSVVSDEMSVSMETTTNVPWYRKLVCKSDATNPTQATVPASKRSVKSAEDKFNKFISEGIVGKPSRQSMAESSKNLPLKKKASDKLNSGVTRLTFIEMLKQGRRRLQHADELNPLQKKSLEKSSTASREKTADTPETTLINIHYVEVPILPPSEEIQSTKKKIIFKDVEDAKFGPLSPEHKKTYKSRTVATVTKIHYIEVQIYPSSGIFVPTAENPKSTDEASVNQQSTKMHAAGVLVDSIMEALNEFSFLSPFKLDKETWKAWASSFFDSLNLKKFSNLKTWASSLLTILTNKVKAVGKPMEQAKSWWSQLVNFTRSESDRIRNEAPKEYSYDDRFFNSPSYQHRSSKNRTAEAILDVSGMLYSAIDQLMAEGNQHFANMTHLQAAWDGFYRRESVLNSSRALKTMGKASENRKLLTTYVGMVHKFARLVTNISEATDRIAKSPVITAADVTHWKSVKGGFNKFLREVRQRPFFMDRELLVSEGFHQNILIGGREKLESARLALEKMTRS